LNKRESSTENDYSIPLALCYSSPQAAIKEEKAAAEAALKAAEAEVNDKVEAAKAALSDAAEKLTAAAADASAELKDIAQAGFKSLLAGWEQAKKTFDENRK
jgi:hypothetical protein